MLDRREPLHSPHSTAQRLDAFPFELRFGIKIRSCIGEPFQPITFVIVHSFSVPLSRIECTMEICR